ncbi:Hypothetical predicted protein [Podarcis lilfordi]|uniref:Fibrinogen C-terminal domain-containing protein n=1 Tax=Podarcis lilfordi TaxID=74358 RepID=A0AA35LHH9_9SAUR|nr:Hypothetical predicted protein [Podarcis lilfordi]
MKRPAVMRHPPVKTMMCTRQSGSAGSSKRSPRANRNVLAAEATIPVPSVDSETPSVGSVPEGATSLRSANRLRLTRPPSPTRKSKSSLQSAKESCFALTNCHCLSGTTIGQTDSPTRRKLNVTVLTEGAPCDMEIDTGSALSIVSWSTIKRLVPRVSKRQLDSHRVHVVFPRQSYGSVDFDQDWDSWKRAFGSQLMEFWLGNDHLHLLSSLGDSLSYDAFLS